MTTPWRRRRCCRKKAKKRKSDARPFLRAAAGRFRREGFCGVYPWTLFPEYAPAPGV
jgi:hypothetical protein